MIELERTGQQLLIMICRDRDDSIGTRRLRWSFAFLQSLICNVSWSCTACACSSMAFWAWFPVNADRISAGPPVVAREEPGWIAF
jgi:hypothetical protein